MGGFIHLVQRGGDWAGYGPAQSPPRCTKCNSPPINGQCTSHCIAIWWVKRRKSHVRLPVLVTAPENTGTTTAITTAAGTETAVTGNTGRTSGETLAAAESATSSQQIFITLCYLLYSVFRRNKPFVFVLNSENKKELDAGMWRYHANRMDARRSQFDLGRVVAYI